METQRDTVSRVIGWINQAESQALQEGSYADGGDVTKLHWMKSTLLDAPTEMQLDLLRHWAMTGMLPIDLLLEEHSGEE